MPLPLNSIELLLIQVVTAMVKPLSRSFALDGHRVWHAAASVARVRGGQQQRVGHGVGVQCSGSAAHGAQQGRARKVRRLACKLTGRDETVTLQAGGAHPISLVAKHVRASAAVGKHFELKLHTGQTC